jgi:hypothetical protein
MGTGTYTRSVVDVRPVLNNFGADFNMVAQSTGLWTRESVDSTVADLIRFAAAGYLVWVVLILWDSKGAKIRGRKYTISDSTVGWRSDDPGDNLWPPTPGGQLQLIAQMNSNWANLGALGQAAEKKKIGITGSWSPTSTDTSFPGMTAVSDRQYSSNGFGMQRVTYK